MILAFDTYYFDVKAKTVCLAFDEWTAAESFEVYSEILENIEEYRSGEFYKRELPCILSLLNQIDLHKVQTIIVDGYVFLDDDGKPGLGYYLYKALNSEIPVIGVAKSNFATIDKLKRPVMRGDSKSPLFVTAIGIDLDEAAKNIGQMSGCFRIPAILKQLDSMTKDK